MYTKALTALAALLATSSASPIKRQETGNNNSSNKRGICYTDASLTQAFGGSASWAYHWSATSGGSLPEGMEFVPTLHPDEADMGNNYQNPSFVGLAQEALNGNTKHLLFLNEPNKAPSEGGTAISATQAAAMYRSPAFQGSFGGNPDVKLGGPGIAADGIQWLRDFAAACSDCQFDFIPLHFYDWTEGHVGADIQLTSMKGFMKDTIAEVKQMFKKSDGSPVDIWITEFGFVDIYTAADGSRKQRIPVSPDLMGEQQQYMEAALQWLDSDDDIARYAYFMADKNILLDQSGALSTIGSLYTNGAQNNGPQANGAQ